jgi:tetratricopeptide (TPR) repeat protein
LRQGAIQSALDDFNAAVNANPNLYFARINRGHVLTINRDYDGALKDFAEAERINPAAPGTYNYRCLTYTAMGQFDKALADATACSRRCRRTSIRWRAAAKSIWPREIWTPR